MRSELESRPALDWEGCVSAFIQAKQEAEEKLWEMGEIAASVDRTYGTRAIPKFASEVGYSARRIYELAATWAAWESRGRSQVLSFGHHEAIAGSENPEELKERAEDDQLSVREVKEIVQGEQQKRIEEEHGASEVVRMMKCPRCLGAGEVIVE